MSGETVIQFRISSDLKNELKKRATELNMSLSAYIIYLTQKDLGKL